MSETNNLEARARAAARTLADRKKREGELQSAFDRLRAEARQLRSENERLADQAGKAIKDKAGLLEENQQLREDNKRLSESSGKHKGELERLSKEVERLVGENERVTSLMEALVVQIELNLQGEAAIHDAAAHVAEAGPGGQAAPARPAPRPESVVSEMREKYHRDPIEEVEDERARSLLSSIKSRL